MATLTADDFQWCAQWIRGKPTHLNILKTSGLSRPQLQAALQAIEDYSVNSYNNTPTTSLRTAINNATGATPTLAQNTAVWYAWAAWKGRED